MRLFFPSRSYLPLPPAPAPLPTEREIYAKLGCLLFFDDIAAEKVYYSVLAASISRTTSTAYSVNIINIKKNIRKK